MPDSEEQAIQSYIEDLQSGKLNYGEARRRYMELGDQIRDRYEKEITAISVDVVNSRGAKGFGTPLEAQATFDSYHKWVEEKLRDYGCNLSEYTWSGDGLLAVFKKPEEAVGMARALLEGLPAFNRLFNRLMDTAGQTHPLRLRIGVHTGRILQGEAPGVGKIASATFDVAGHLQKTASPDQMAISETTYAALAGGGGQFVQIRRDMPNPGVCFVFPPHTAPEAGALLSSSISAAPGAPSARAAAPALGWLPWAVAVGSVMLLCVLVGVWWPRTPGPAAPGPGTTTPPPSVILRPEPAPGSGGGAVSPPAPTAPSAGAAPAPAPAAAAPSPSAAQPAAWEPSRQLWRSPDADSGLPVRMVPSPPELRWLLCIGVGGYRDKSLAAEGAAKDAQLAAQALQRGAGVPSDHARLLTDENATLGNVKLAFQWLQQHAGSGRDTVLVYLAGASAVAPDRPDARHPGGTSYAFLPYDASPQDLPNTAVYGTDIASWLGATRSQTAVVLADTGFAGAMDYPTAADQGRQYGLIAAAGALQRSAAARGSQGSAFAEALAAGLAGSADGNHDHQVSLDELQQYLRAEVSRRSGGAQTPEARAGFGGYLPELSFISGG
jgi:class 3 adenylate cyclase